MRAIYLEHLIDNEFYLLEKDDAHHLINVVRIEKDDEVLLLNGQGKKIKTVVEEVSKRQVVLKKTGQFACDTGLDLDVALGIPKKEALELCLKQAQELGVKTLYMVRAQYSQMKAPELERVKSLLISALEQSNAGFLTQVQSLSWDKIPYQNYETIIILDSQHEVSQEFSLKGKTLLIVGPEGGFSPEEFNFFLSLSQLKQVRLPTPILRSPTALATGVGFIIGRL